MSIFVFPMVDEYFVSSFTILLQVKYRSINLATVNVIPSWLRKSLKKSVQLRRVDLRDHDSYESLTQKLDDMFRDFGLNTEGVRPSYLLSGKSEYVLAYKNDVRDLMFAGDVPWRNFRSSVKKIRIMKNYESYRFGYCEPTVEAAALEESKTIDNI
ncbi:auxin-responsive protein IAA10 [Artemisia annua]|uniref:Auxin-responsive protein n=1 Tax=Artemisia annua TaxID=35608 RepID=A0A2U1MPV8_ARTAN|nr:auxin-responsive protein IAA10 [Artemisia annua]